jgi:hypothetical protein
MQDSSTVAAEQVQRQLQRTKKLSPTTQDGFPLAAALLDPRVRSKILPVHLPFASPGPKLMSLSLMGHDWPPKENVVPSLVLHAVELHLL